MVIDMEDKNELIDKLTSYQKFNTEKSEKFTENQKTTFAQKRKEFFSIYEILRNLYLEVDSIDLEIKKNYKEFRKRFRYIAITALCYGLISWFFEISDKTNSIVAVIFFLFFADVYFNQRIIEVANGMRIIAKNESIRHYSFLLNNSVSSSTHGDYQREYDKLKEKKQNDLYYEYSDKEKIIIKIFDASVSASIIEDITGEYFDEC
jgi:hypothetical protein